MCDLHHRFQLAGLLK
jgi:hypothetical protein